MRSIALAIAMLGESVYYGLQPARLEVPVNAWVTLATFAAFIVCVIGGW